MNKITAPPMKLWVFFSFLPVIIQGVWQRGETSRTAVKSPAGSTLSRKPGDTFTGSNMAAAVRFPESPSIDSRLGRVDYGRGFPSGAVNIFIRNHVKRDVIAIVGARVEIFST
jgi:hypothetical protein